MPLLQWDQGCLMMVMRAQGRKQAKDKSMRPPTRRLTSWPCSSARASQHHAVKGGAQAQAPNSAPQH